MGTGEDPRRPRAVVVLVSPACTRSVAPIEWDTRCDLDLVHRLLWLHVWARRMGWWLRLTEVDDELRELIELVGVSRLLLPPESDDARERRRHHGPGRPGSTRREL